MNTDREIVEGILADSEYALREFYETHAPKVTNFVRLRVSNEKDVEEIVQDSLLATIEALRDFTFSCALSTFICSIAKRKVVDYYRRKSLRRIVWIDSAHFDIVLSVLSNPEERLDNAFLAETVEGVFRKINPLYGRILHMKYVDGLSVVEIARELAMSFKSVESMLFRARKAFVLAYGPTV